MAGVADPRHAASMQDSGSCPMVASMAGVAARGSKQRSVSNQDSGSCPMVASTAGVAARGSKHGRGSCPAVADRPRGPVVE